MMYGIKNGVYVFNRFIEYPILLGLPNLNYITVVSRSGLG